jgi:hypothetical protein|tara:strand:+ start:57 stop:1265 length:1209 start_codon:yes stop_codon:yes gene_type:complete
MSIITLPAVLESVGVEGLVRGDYVAVRKNYPAMQAMMQIPVLLPQRARRSASSSPQRSTNSPRSRQAPQEAALASLFHAITAAGASSGASVSGKRARGAYRVEYLHDLPLAAESEACRTPLWSTCDVVLTSLRAVDNVVPPPAGNAERVLAMELAELVEQARAVVQELCEEHGFVVLDALERGSAAWGGHTVLRHCTQVMRASKESHAAPLPPPPTEAVPEKAAARGVIMASAMGALLALHLLRRLGGVGSPQHSTAQVQLAARPLKTQRCAPIEVRNAPAPPPLGHYSHPSPPREQGFGRKALPEGFTHWDRFEIPKLVPSISLREWVARVHAHFSVYGARLTRVRASRGRGSAVLFEAHELSHGGRRPCSEILGGCRTVILELELESGEALLSPPLQLQV